MFASISVPVSLILMTAMVGLAADTSVSVYLRAAGRQPQPVLESMKAETESVLGPIGHPVQWWSPGDTTNGMIVVMDLRGNCEPLPDGQALPLPAGAPLGSTLVVNGNVIPFGQVNCDSISRYLSRALAGVPAPLRKQQLGRALGRVLAHEIYHVLNETRDHAHAGVAKPEFTPAELMSPSFGFEAAPALAWSSNSTNAPATHDK